MKQSIALLCHSFSNRKKHKQSYPTLSKLALFALLSVAAPNAFSANLDSKDSDDDGLSDIYEEKIGTEAYLADTDGDGINDGIEVGKNSKKPLNSDNDKYINALDYDDDNDGLPTFLESQKDTDKDGIKDYLDTDSDNDGLVDGKEAGALNQDKNLDGIDDAFDTGRAGAVDKNGDGIDDNFKLPDHNKDGIADYLDASYQKPEASTSTLLANPKANLVANVDSKKTKEHKKSAAKDTATNQPSVSRAKVPTVKKEVVKKPEIKSSKKVEVNRYTDTDNDGLLDSQEIVLGTDVMKRDSDGDKVSDAIEIGMDIHSPQDSDRDGIIDALDDDDDNDGILTKFEDINKDSTAINDDTDQDGVPNYLDANDDGDDRVTKDEGGTKDSDGDGILDYLDKNDGVKDDTPKVASKETLPDEPEIVVLFDGNMSSLSKESDIEEEIEEDFTKQDNVKQGSDLAKQAIESAVSNGSLKNHESNQSSAKNSNSEKMVVNTVAINDEAQIAPEKKKDGIMQWLTSLLPD